jgi:hypothetical protein
MIYTRPFIFRAFAEDYLSFPHTIQQKGSAMGGIGKEQKQGVARFQSPVFFAVPPPPPPWVKQFLAHIMHVTYTISTVCILVMLTNQ